MPAFEVKVTSKGQITIPAELRAVLSLKPGDKVELYLDRELRLLVRPRNLSPTAVFENAPKPKSDTQKDDGRRSHCRRRA
jgi:AbrB family looped-hinge helix DNA binding protein